jgi:glucose-1-phosphate cytidylyltransferase
MESKMKVVLLAGGFGSRLSEETEVIPKPMVEVGGRPIIARVMDIYSHFGHNEFIVAAGYKAMLLKQLFANFHLMANDIKVSVDTGKITLVPCSRGGWDVTVVDTGLNTMTSGRIRRVSEWLNNEPFMVTYSDGLGNIDIAALLDFHKSHGRLATVTAVQPPARFGAIQLKGDRVEAFSEKVRPSDSWINGGFFVFEPGVMDYFLDDNEPLEHTPLTQMARDGQLMAYRHNGFWHPMDTLRDRNSLNALCDEKTPPWLQFGRDAQQRLNVVAV